MSATASCKQHDITSSNGGAVAVGWPGGGGGAALTFVPGAAQGAATVLLGHPLDTAKTRMQAAGPQSSASLWRTAVGMVRAEGPRALYRGAAPPLVMEGAKRSIQFALWDVFRGVNNSTNNNNNNNNNNNRSSVLAQIGGNAFISGALAGGIGTLIGCPMHVIKIQTQNQTAATTRNALTCTAQIYRAEGLRGYYRGFRYNLLKDVVFAGCYLGLYDTLRSHTNAFAAGATASVITWTLLYPLDTVKTLVQARQAHTVHAVLRSPSRLYRGLLAALLKSGPVSGAAMMVYEAVRRRLLPPMRSEGGLEWSAAASA